MNFRPQIVKTFRYLVRHSGPAKPWLRAHIKPLGVVAFLTGSVIIGASFLPSPSPTPVAIPVVTIFSRGLPLPSVSARHIFIIDVNTRQVLFQKDADIRIYPASTTKMMTALVALEHYGLTEIIEITTSFPEGQDIGLAPGERISVEKLMYALLVQSANDAAEVLAQNYPGGRSQFIEAMNQKASQLQLHNTHFVNPTGLDEPDHYSSAADLSRIARVLALHPTLARIVSTENAVITSSDYAFSHILTNVNQLLGTVPGVVGVKTGFTDLAGQSLITLVNRDNHLVLISLLGSQDRFTDTRNLIDWVYANFNWP